MMMNSLNHAHSLNQVQFSHLKAKKSGSYGTLLTKEFEAEVDNISFVGLVGETRKTTGYWDKK
jgi:hypothetical protein